MTTKDTKLEEWWLGLEQIGREIVDGAFKVLRELGPGLLESVYETCLTRELTKRGVAVSRQVSLPIVYDGEKLNGGLRLDLLVEEAIIIEIKAVEKLSPLHHAAIADLPSAVEKEDRLPHQFQCQAYPRRNPSRRPLTSALCPWWLISRRAFSCRCGVLRLSAGG